jgi:hypothetical protein
VRSDDPGELQGLHDERGLRGRDVRRELLPGTVGERLRVVCADDGVQPGDAGGRGCNYDDGRADDHHHHAVAEHHHFHDDNLQHDHVRPEHDDAGHDHDDGTANDHHLHDDVDDDHHRSADHDHDDARHHYDDHRTLDHDHDDFTADDHHDHQQQHHDHDARDPVLALRRHV